MPQNAHLHFFGAAGSVTGSCMLLETANARALIDCGMFQGSKTLKTLNYRASLSDPTPAPALLLPPPHTDHGGPPRRPARAGSGGPIPAPRATINLCSAMRRAGGAIQELAVETPTRRNQRRGVKEVQPIYT